MITQDIRYAIRSIRRAPGFAAVALITLALGIGGTTAIFSVVDGILLRPLPYPDAAAIVSISRTSPAGNDEAFSAADYLDYSRSSQSFAAIAGYRQEIVTLTGVSQPVRLQGLETTAAFFDVFGLPPLLGRIYTKKTDAPTGPRIALISENVWRQHFGSDSDVVGKTLQLNGVPTTIIGVMPSRFVHPSEADLWMLAPNEVPTSPLPIDGDLVANREVNYFMAIARLRNVNVEQANAELRTISARLAREHALTNEAESAIVVPYHESLVGDVRWGLLVLLGAMSFVLLIACANVASLLLARGAGRRREFAVRTAIGAGRRRLVGQQLTESFVLAGVGGLGGVIVASWGIDALIAFAPETIPRLNDVRLDRRVALFSVLATALVGLLFGIVPAFLAARRQVTDGLRDGGRTATSRTRLQNCFVVGEVALALVLLIGAGLMLTSFARLRAVDLGYSLTNLIAVGVPLPQAKYDAAAQIRFYTTLSERLHQNPITARSAIVFPLPFSGAGAAAGYHVEGTRRAPRAERPQAQISAVTPGYFATLGVPLLRGRDVALTDTRDRPNVIVINKTMADRHWPGLDPLGKRIGFGADVPTDDALWATVVGVVADSRRSDLASKQDAAMYFPHAQFILPFMTVVVRSSSTQEAIAVAVRDATRTIDSDLPIGEVGTIERLVQRSTGQPRFRALLISAFAAVALLLAGVGLYGLISYTVTQRVPEIGVRLALGATPFQVGRYVIGHGMMLAGAGVVLGLAAALGVTRLLQGLLFSISATDPAVYASLAATLLIIAALASYIPARRAMRVDPITALRAE